VRFTLNGREFALTRSQVEARLAKLAPEPIMKLGVKVNGVCFPVRQALEAAIGVPRSTFISHTARRQLAALGFEVIGEPEPRELPSATPRGRAGTASAESWHAEATVQATLVSTLVAGGWTIVSQADTASKQHGIDVVATHGELTAGIEVKGYPSRSYADPRREHETKRAHPTTQAAHWYSQALLAAMRLRTRQPDYLSVIALPDFPRYRTLHADTRASLAACGIEVWWVDANGEVAGVPQVGAAVE